MTERALQDMVGVIQKDVTVQGDMIIHDIHVGDKIIQMPRELPPLWVNVPSLPNYFLGRDALVDDLVARLCAGQSAALSAEGLPGVGKTTLAVVLAYHPRVLAHFADGVLWAGLGPNPDVPSQLASWATALGIDVSDRPASAARAQAVRNAIGQRRLLLVIDDAWQSDAADLLRCGGPACSHLLTTRDQAIARHFAGAAQALSVPTLEDDPAFAFLQALAPEACAADPAAARSLARAVDGLPLALELLGGYLAAPERSYFAELSAAALDELADPARRLQLATRRLGAINDAQVTLRETITLSLEGLPEETVAAFHALGAFAPKPATFSLEAAEAVIGVSAASGIRRTFANIFRPKAVKTEARNSTATVALLVARNLLERGDGERLALHQVLADVARTKLKPAAIESHRDYYLALVDEDREDWQQIQVVYSQMQQALAWQLAMQPDDERLFAFYRSLHTYQQRQGLWSDYENLVTQCLAWAQAKQDIRRQAWLLNDLGYMHSALGEKGKALDYYEQALPLSRQVGDRSGEATTLNNIGLVYGALGEKGKALDYYEQALPLRRQVGDRSGEATTLNNIGGVYDALSEKGKALEYYEQALLLMRQIGDMANVAGALNNIGSVYSALGEKQEALGYYEQALPLSRQVGDRSGEATTLNNMASIYYWQGDFERAAEMFIVVVGIMRQLGAVGKEAAVTFNLAFVLHHHLNDTERGVELMQRAVGLLRQYRLPQDAAGQTLVQHEAFLAELLGARGEPENEDE